MTSNIPIVRTSGKTHLILCVTSQQKSDNPYFFVTNRNLCKIANTCQSFDLLNCPPCSDAVESVSSLYSHVEEQAHDLVQRTNLSLEHLEYLLQLREFEAHFMQVR